MTSLQTRIDAMRDELVNHRADGYATTTDVLLLLELIEEGGAAVSDARSAAWLAAWERLEVASKIQPGNPGDVNGQMRMDAKQSLLAEAAIFAELAKAPMEVGFAAGEWIEQRARKERENRDDFERILGERP